jgi:hypothetical protein
MKQSTNWKYCYGVVAVIFIFTGIAITLLGCDTNNDDGATNWRDFSISEATIISQTGIDLQGYFPDGKISIIKDEATEKYIAFWAEFISFRTEANTPYLEDHISQVKLENRVFGKGFDEQEGFNDGGSWFIGVHRLSDGRLAGFFHAESHWAVGDGVYKSIGITYSSDNGRTWTAGEKILNVNYSKPATAAWTGLGDGCVVYNEKIGQFICYYSAFSGIDYRICMAASSDPAGTPGTWKKWNGSNFTVDGYNISTGIGGIDTHINGLESIHGANPSVMWNNYLQKWIMVYHRWDPKVIYMSVSNDGLVWETPIAITNNNSETAWYPNLLGNNGDTIGSEIIKFYYARNQNPSTGVRELAVRTITFK